MNKSAMKILLTITLCLSIQVFANSTAENGDFELEMSQKCAENYSEICLKLDVSKWLDKLDQTKNITILPGVTITHRREGRSSQPENRLDLVIVKKLVDYFDTHSLNFEKDETADEDNEVSEARRRKNRGGGMGMIMAAAAMMKGTLMALGLAGVAALAGKALMTGMIAMMLSAIIGIKGLSGGGKSTTYEVITKPIHTHMETHSSAHDDYGHHGRSFGAGPLPLGLQPQYQPA